MYNMINDLADVLDQEVRVYNDLLRLSKDKTRVVVEGKISELEAIVKLEQSLILQMRRLEDIREELVGKLSDKLDVKPSDLTVSELMKHIEVEQAQRLKKCQDKLVHIIDELKNTNDLNSKLIKNSLDYIEFSINLMSGTGDANNGYGSTGQVNRSKGRSFFDVKL